MRILFLTSVVAILAFPFAFAHTDGGIYGAAKTYCEYLKGDQNVHDYAGGAGAPLFPFLVLFVDGNAQDCDGDGVPYDYDGHSEWAVGGAWLLASDAGAPLAGSTACFGEYPHHPLYPDAWVFDHVWAAGVIFFVAADTVNLVGPDPTTGVDCGDGLEDTSTPYCVDHCPVGFAPGTDGAYRVYIIGVRIDGEDHYFPATLGHVYT